MKFTQTSVSHRGRTATHTHTYIPPPPPPISAGIAATHLMHHADTRGARTRRAPRPGPGFSPAEAQPRGGHSGKAPRGRPTRSSRCRRLGLGSPSPPRAAPPRRHHHLRFSKASPASPEGHPPRPPRAARVSSRAASRLSLPRPEQPPGHPRSTIGSPAAGGAAGAEGQAVPAELLAPSPRQPGVRRPRAPARQPPLPQSPGTAGGSTTARPVTCAVPT